MRFLLVFQLVSMLSITAHAERLSLDGFLKQVADKNESLSSQRLDEKAAEFKASEADLLTSVNFFSSAKYASDQKESQNPSFEGNRRHQTLFEIGLEQQSSFGITHKLYSSYDRFSLEGADPAYISQPNITKSALIYEFNVSLWRNSFGKATRLQEDVIVGQSRSDSLSARYARKTTKVNAITTYWRLKTVQELLILQNDMLEKDKKFLSWVRGRVRDRLGEDSDLKQAEAAMELRQYDLEKTNTELIAATEAFNEMRQVAVNTPTPELDAFPATSTSPVAPGLKEVLMREDIKSLEALLTSQKAQYELSADGTKPQLDFMGQASTNGLDPDTDPAIRKSFTTEHPAYLVGLKLTIPLARSSVNNVQDSALAKSSSVEMQLNRKRYEVVSELERLERSLTQAQRLLQLARSVESAQQAKLTTETKRLRIGRTTTFQLLSFQQDYQQAKQELIRAQGTVLQLSAQFMLFDTQSKDLL